MQKIILGLAALLLSFSISYAQTTNDPHIIYSGGIIASRYLGVEAGVLYGTYVSSSCSSGILVGYKFSSEAYRSPRSFILAPKIGYEIDVLTVGFRGSIADYTDFNKHDFRIIPEAGFTLAGLMDIFYGYNIPITATKLPETPGHRLTVSVNIDPRFPGW